MTSREGMVATMIMASSSNSNKEAMGVNSNSLAMGVSNSLAMADPHSQAVAVDPHSLLVAVAAAGHNHCSHHTLPAGHSSLAPKTSRSPEVQISEQPIPLTNIPK